MFNKILVPLDGSQLAECSLGHVEDLVTRCGVAEVILLTVTEEVKPPIVEWASQEQINQVFEAADKVREKLKQKAGEYLNKVSTDLKHSGLTVQTEVIEASIDKHPAEMILDYADKNIVDLIVLSTHGRSGISRWAFGSQSERIVRQSRIPVLTVTPSGCRNW